MRVNIWPWSTIRKLREALADKTAEALIWERAQERAWEVADAAIDRESALVLKLAEATKNDTRDPKTGRFVKAER